MVLWNNNAHGDLECLADVAIQPKIFGNKLVILTKILILRDYFLICQRSTFNLENNKSLCEGYFPIQLVTESTCSKIIFQNNPCISQRHIQNFERNCEKSNSIRVDNFAKSINF